MILVIEYKISFYAYLGTYLVIFIAIVSCLYFLLYNQITSLVY